MTKPVRTYDKTKGVEKLAEKGRLGNYQLIEPLDLILMGHLPKEGALFGGLYPLGETVQNLYLKFEKKVKITTISTRLRVLNIQGLVVNTMSVSEGRGKTVWQRTPKGDQLLADRKEKKG